MKWTSALAIYILFWVMSAFFVLPFHGRRNNETPSEVAGADPGAPANLPVQRILVQVTILATLSFSIYYLIYTRLLP